MRGEAGGYPDVEDRRVSPDRSGILRSRGEKSVVLCTMGGLRDFQLGEEPDISATNFRNAWILRHARQDHLVRRLWAVIYVTTAAVCTLAALLMTHLIEKRNAHMTTPREPDFKAPRTSRWTSIQPHRGHHAPPLLCCLWPRRRACRSRVSSSTACAMPTTRVLVVPCVADAMSSPPALTQINPRPPLVIPLPGTSSRSTALRNCASSSDSGRQGRRLCLLTACRSSVQRNWHRTCECLLNTSSSSPM